MPRSISPNPDSFPVMRHPYSSSARPAPKNRAMRTTRSVLCSFQYFMHTPYPFRPPTVIPWVSFFWTQKFNALYKESKSLGFLKINRNRASLWFRFKNGSLVNRQSSLYIYYCINILLHVICFVNTFMIFFISIMLYE